MRHQRLQILVLSDLFPSPPRPAYGIFVERQTSHTQAHCDNTVVVPTRVFPHLRIWSAWRQPCALSASWRQWRQELGAIPARADQYGYPVYYPRYTSPPRQVIHALWGFFAYAAVSPLLRRLHREHRFDLIHAHYGTPAGVVGLLARRWMQVPVVISVHGADVTFTAPQHAAGHAVTRWAFRSADQVIANSTWTARRVERYAGDIRPKLVFLGGDAAAHLAPPRRRDDGRLTILSVGYVEERKGQAVMVAALRQLVDQGCQLHYVVVGNGSDLGRVRRLTHELGLDDHVSFEGYRAHQEVWAYFADCDIFALPSWDEAFGVVYIEALGQGKPVVGCVGQGGPEDLARYGDCVELVNPRDVTSLVAGLRRLIDDPERRRRMGTLGREIVAKYFTWEHNARETVAIYRQAIHERAGQ
jgi:glycosyltransferase involved in cell wall biosynthesis